MTALPAISAAATPVASAKSSRAGFAALGQGDFLRLMTVQMQQQDPSDPVDQKEMLAQMAQFSSLAGITEMTDTLKAISVKLDRLAAIQSAPKPVPTQET
jgi:flagellar basal-body rod modification protein FlgD